MGARWRSEEEEIILLTNERQTGREGGRKEVTSNCSGSILRVCGEDGAAPHRICTEQTPQDKIPSLTTQRAAVDTLTEPGLNMWTERAPPAAAAAAADMHSMMS